MNFKGRVVAGAMTFSALIFSSVALYTADITKGGPLNIIE